MTLIVRAIVPSADAERQVDGLIAVRDGDIAALASAADGAPAADEPSLRAHHDIVSRIHDGGPSLPSRFGQAFADERALATAIGSRREDLAAALARVGDRVEMSITLAWRTPIARIDVREPRTGREFLESRAAQERQRQDAEAAVERLLTGLASDRASARSRICPREGVAAIVAVLTERDGVRGLRERVYAFAQSDERVIATVHGPMPPYSFVS